MADVMPGGSHLKNGIEFITAAAERLSKHLNTTEPLNAHDYLKIAKVYADRLTTHVNTLQLNIEQGLKNLEGKENQ